MYRRRVRGFMALGMTLTDSSHHIPFEAAHRSFCKLLCFVSMTECTCTLYVCMIGAKGDMKNWQPPGTSQKPQNQPKQSATAQLSQLQLQQLNPFPITGLVQPYSSENITILHHPSLSNSCHLSQICLTLTELHIARFDVLQNSKTTRTWLICTCLVPAGSTLSHIHFTTLSHLNCTCWFSVMHMHQCQIWVELLLQVCNKVTAPIMYNGSVGGVFTYIMGSNLA